MGVNWTPQQQQVIDLRDRNILVSAAAGSGKTAVLVERIIQRVMDKAHPMDVDRLLVVTFTEAAAAEMKERIRAAIEKALDEHPEDEHLQRQATMIHTAMVTTIHSFCLSVIREHFHVIDLDPGFRIAEEGELTLLRQDVLEELLEEKYELGEESFLEFAERFSTGRDDKKIEELILKLYEYSRSYPDPDEWLAGCCSAYEPREGQENAAMARVVSLAGAYLEDGLEMIREALELSKSPDGPYMYEEMLASDLDQVHHAAQARDFARMYTALYEIKWMRLSAKKDLSVSVEKRDYVKALRQGVKDRVGELKKQFFYEPAEELQQELESCLGPMQELTGLVIQFAKSFAGRKSSKNVIDFGDMEHFALQILTTRENGERVPSVVAGEYQQQFDEIMIDEYQDSNYIQEAILTSVSTVRKEKYNIFMVGDVKQSIYRFRLSRPELFMEKFDTYSREDGEKQRIDLHMNFRSRAEVIDSVNFIFEQIMTKKLGGITYDDQAALHVGASYEPQCDAQGESMNKTEVILVDTNLEIPEDSEADENQITDTARELEARAVARRIKELRTTNRVLDKETGEYVPVHYRDMVILTRSIRGWTDTFARILNEEGIPTYAGKKEGYFETYEVAVLLDYLRVLDNVQQDLPLTAVLTSPLVGLTAAELAQIRSAYPESRFHRAVRYYSEENAEAAREGTVFDKSLVAELKKFQEKLINFRERIPYHGIHELLWQIIEETGYGDYVAAMPGGEQRRANIDMLVEKAVAFEGTSYKGLFNFVRYIEQLRKYDVDYGEASIADEQMDTVRLMSIHKSKGLEFPIVFVAGMGKRFNKQDSKGSIVIHPEWGVGVDDIDLTKRTKSPTILKKMIQKEVDLENSGEELRILYVALTRAKEKLIMVGSVKNAEDTLKKYAPVAGRAQWELSFTDLSKADTYFAWVLPALVRMKPEIPMGMRVIGWEELAVADTVEEVTGAMAKEVLLNWDTEQVYEEHAKEQIAEQFSYVYPHSEENQLKLKFTVSELKKRAYLEEEAGEILLEEPEVIPYLPRFLQEEEELTGASRGTAYHRLLELLDFAIDYDEPALEAAIETFTTQKKMSQDMASCIRRTDILGFLQTGAGQRMQAAARKNLLKKEQPFVLGVDAREVYPDTASGETILVQGIIDVCFEEADGLVVLDYKTDKATGARELAEKYHAQLEYYAKALMQLTGKPVKQKVIYSFTLGEEIELS
ncbi:helicase-exonuclease AddAB subunit AddA [Hespellia stercorisuis]|uniref:ATP-dependent helicase/nuclease subunit A n=1 Tax=Hespellia stercorisuis DSM 15480 TaxID=1121950 RepID=A0A1M6T275_9FIRM|nr:helicase-exonuclease AddAB subunit AddA [Hespellia stercorisuis]SHK51031.1 DNA helicase/exodeoxyribonuclease V, subunit A [Hespellia stercorisuis DSM 15480]